MSPSCGPGKSTLAIGSPLASDFFDPQNCKTISSSIENESSLRPIKPVSRRTTANSNDNMMSRTSISDGATAPHIFSTIPLENATYMISRNDPRSAYPRTFLLRCIHWPIHGRVNCPAMKGASNCSMMSRKMSKDRATPLAWSNQPARRGLMKTPRKFDSDAAHNAAATLPPAIDVNAIDDCTRSEEHTSELQSLMRISYAVFCLKNKKKR